MSFSREQFLQARGEYFCVNPTNDQKIRLTNVGDIRSCGQGFISYSLLFDAAVSDRLLNQGTYPLHNEALGSADIFIAPIHYVDGSHDKRYYEAVFTQRTTL